MTDQLRLHSCLDPADTPSFLAFLAPHPSPTPGFKPLPGTSLGVRQLASLGPNCDGSLPGTRAPLPATTLLVTTTRYEICRAYFHEGCNRRANSLNASNSMSILSGLSSETSLATRISTRSSPSTGPVPRPPRNARRSINGPANSATKVTPWPRLHDTLFQEGFDISESYLFRILRRAGLTATRHHRSTPQPGQSANDGSVVPDVADVRSLSLKDGRRFPTKVAGLFLFLPLLLDLDLPRGRRRGSVARLGGDPAFAGVARLAGPQAARQSVASVTSATSVMMRAPGCSPVSTSCPRSPTRPTIPTRPNGP